MDYRTAVAAFPRICAEQFGCYPGFVRCEIETRGTRLLFETTHPYCLAIYCATEAKYYRDGKLPWLREVCVEAEVYGTYVNVLAPYLGVQHHELAMLLIAEYFSAKIKTSGEAPSYIPESFRDYSGRSYKIINDEICKIYAPKCPSCNSPVLSEGLGNIRELRAWTTRSAIRKLLCKNSDFIELQQEFPLETITCDFMADKVLSRMSRHSGCSVSCVEHFVNTVLVDDIRGWCQQKLTLLKHRPAEQKCKKLLGKMRKAIETDNRNTMQMLEKEFARIAAS